MNQTPPKSQTQTEAGAPPHVPGRRAINTLLRLPRSVRIVLVAFFALAVALALSPMVDAVYLRFMYTSETRIVPSLITAAFGLVMYVLGWNFVIGTVGETPPARLFILWYFGIGLLALLIAVLWLLQGLATGSAS